jgi:hypothetical protein
MSSRRLNWVEHKRILEQLPVRVENLKYKTEVQQPTYITPQALFMAFINWNVYLHVGCNSGKGKDIQFTRDKYTGPGKTLCKC